MFPGLYRVQATHIKQCITITSLFTKLQCTLTFYTDPGKICSPVLSIFNFILAFKYRLKEQSLRSVGLLILIGLRWRLALPTTWWLSLSFLRSPQTSTVIDCPWNVLSGRRTRLQWLPVSSWRWSEDGVFLLLNVVFHSVPLQVVQPFSPPLDLLFSSPCVPALSLWSFEPYISSYVITL